MVKIKGRIKGLDRKYSKVYIYYLESLLPDCNETEKKNIQILIDTLLRRKSEVKFFTDLDFKYIVLFVTAIKKNFGVLEKITVNFGEYMAVILDNSIIDLTRDENLSTLNKDISFQSYFKGVYRETIKKLNLPI